MVFHEAVVKDTYDDIIPLNFGCEECKSAHSFGPAVRSFWLIHYVASGFGTFVREGVTYTVGPGQMFVIPPGIVTTYTADKNKPWTYHWVGFECKGELPMQLGAVHTCPEAGEIFERMKSGRGLENGRSAYMRGMLWQVFGALLEQDKPTTDYMNVAISYMNTEYVNGITVSDVARELGLNRSYFSQYFKKRAGVCAQKYLINLRMEKAAALMLSSGEKPSIAATSVGYTDIFTFSKMFKRHFGLSPRDYVNRYKQK